MRAKLIVGNWKMNGSRAGNAALLAGIVAGLDGARAQCAVCVPAPYLQQCEDALHGGHIIMEGRLRLLDDVDLEAVPDKDVVNTPPTRTVRPGTVDENNIFHSELLSLYL